MIRKGVELNKMMDEMKKFMIDLNKDNDKEYLLKYEDTPVLIIEEDDVEAVNTLAGVLNQIFYEKEMECKSYQLMMEFYQQLIADTLADKLSNIDNLYAMKTMMTEICTQLEGMASKLVEYNKK